MFPQQRGNEIMGNTPEVNHRYYMKTRGACTLKKQINEHYQRQATLKMLLDWVHEYLDEKDLEKDYWNWKVAKGYVKPEGGLIDRNKEVKR
jgi:hypothetical protein